MQDLVDKLQSKVKSYKRQFEEAVSALGSGPRGPTDQLAWVIHIQPQLVVS